ncbi:MAG: rRNA maturation RNase YbeY [Flavobacteriaceae bacterium]|nr:rRNA maturation RNase YbeY [Flavobacteriaceae bacterium]
MISFNYQGTFLLKDEERHRSWLIRAVDQEGHNISEITYILTTDAELLELNSNFLGHDYYTDILTFDRSDNKTLNGDIFISTERVKENAVLYDESEEEELRRVMIHGILHMMGYNDSNEEEKKLMHKKENIYLKMFHVEQ